jgi:hypothetical protein
VTLGELQRAFTRTIAALVVYAYGQGFELSYGEAWRTPEQAALNAKSGAGIAHSLHMDRLAVDFNLYRGGVWLQRTEDHAPLGAYWKTLHPLARWGGDFHTRPDGNHYSFTWEGRA